MSLSKSLDAMSDTMRAIRMRAPRPACLWRLEWRWYGMTTRLQQVMCDPEADPDGDTWGPLLSQDIWGATSFSVSALEMFLNSRPRESMGTCGDCMAARRLLALSSVSMQAWHAIVVASCCTQRFFWGNALNGTTFRPEDALFQDVQRLVIHAGTTCPHCHEQCGVSRLPRNHLRAEILRSMGAPPNAFLL